MKNNEAAPLAIAVHNIENLDLRVCDLPDETVKAFSETITESKNLVRSAF